MLTNRFLIIFFVFVIAMTALESCKKNAAFVGPIFGSQQESDQQRGVIVPILFATDRQLVKNGLTEDFGDRREYQRDPYYGKIDVIIPSSMQHSGADDFYFWKLTKESVDGDEPLVSNKFYLNKRWEWRDFLEKQISLTPKKDALERFSTVMNQIAIPFDADF